MDNLFAFYADDGFSDTGFAISPPPDTSGAEASAGPPQAAARSAAGNKATGAGQDQVTSGMVTATDTPLTGPCPSLREKAIQLGMPTRPLPKLVAFGTLALIGGSGQQPDRPMQLALPKSRLTPRKRTPHAYGDPEAIAAFCRRSAPAGDATASGLDTAAPPKVAAPSLPLLRMFPLAEVARLVRRSSGTVREWRRTGLLRVVWIGRGWFVREADLLALLGGRIV